MKTSAGIVSLMVALLYGAPAMVHARGFVGVSGQLGWRLPRGRSILSVSLDAGYRIGRWLEIGTTVGFAAAVQRTMGYSRDDHSSSDVFELTDPDVTITGGASGGTTSGSGSASAQDGFDGDRGDHTATDSPSAVGGQLLGTGRVLLHPLLGSLQPFLGLEGGVLLLGESFAGQCSGLVGVQYLVRRRIGLSFGMGYTLARWETTEVNHLLHLQFGVRMYL